MVIYFRSNLENNPSCPHGPMLLFGRQDLNGKCKKFYTCSAYRNKKLCPFHVAEKDIFKHRKLHCLEEKGLLIKQAEKCKLIKTRCNSKISHYCCTCGLLKDANNGSCKGHILVDVNDILIKNPSKLLSTKQNSKAESQYHFTEKTTKTILSIALSTDAAVVLCIGCPSLHEFISNDKNLSSKLKSILLDIDHRYFQFYDENKFQWFNMFNCHMFYDSGWEVLKTLSKEQKILLIVDPPFGGHIEPLADTLKQLSHRLDSADNNNNNSRLLPVMLISPYFMEKIIQKNLFDFNMLDFKVEYVNHKKFKSVEEGGRKLGSPVRIFANIDSSVIRLPKEDGYKFCSPCKKWVSSENKHCLKCGYCTSKNGGVYIHCNICRKCVKSSWKHCHKCKRCTIANHACPDSTKSSKLKKQKIKNKKEVQKNKRSYRSSK